MNLLNVFRTLLPGRAPTRRPAPGRPRSVRPALEGLEDRLALSASSFNLHAIREPNGGSAAYFRNPSNDALTEKSPQGQILQLGVSHEVTDFSAGLDPNGHAAVFAHKDGVMQEFADGAWHSLNQPRAMTSFAAVSGGRMYAVADDNSLWEFAQAHDVSYTVYVLGQLRTYTYRVQDRWTQLWGANAVWSVDAVTQTSNGFDIVFATGGDGRLEKYVPSSNTWQFLQTGYTFTSYSAGLSNDGYADLFMMNNNGTLERWTTLSGTFATVAHYLDPLEETISATSNGEVFVMYAGYGDGSVQISMFDQSNHQTILATPPRGTVTAISAAAPDDVFVMTSGGSLQEHGTAVPNASWLVWT